MAKNAAGRVADTRPGTIPVSDSSVPATADKSLYDKWFGLYLYLSVDANGRLTASIRRRFADQAAAMMRRYGGDM